MKKYDIVIVGGGLGGLYTYAKLKNRFPELDILLLEKSKRLGGRIFTKKDNKTNIPLELGAARYSTVYHKRVSKLISDYSISKHHFKYEKLFVNDISGNKKQYIYGLYKKIKLYMQKFNVDNRSFREIAVAALGVEKFEELIHEIGFDSLRYRFISVNLGLNVLESHPEFQGWFIQNCSGEHWHASSNGLCEIINNLLKDISEYEIFTEVKRVRQSNSGWAIEIMDKDHLHPSITYLECNSVFIATPLSDALTLLGEKNLIKEKNYKVNSIPLMKGFVKISVDKFPRGFNKKFWFSCGLPFRKIYINSDSNLAWFYCDGVSAVYARKKINNFLNWEQELFENLKNTLPYLEVKLIESEGRFQFWEKGLELYSEKQENKSELYHLNNLGLFLVSDSLTEFPGWLEGTLSSADYNIEEYSGRQNLRINRCVKIKK